MYVCRRGKRGGNLMLYIYIYNIKTINTSDMNTKSALKEEFQKKKQFFDTLKTNQPQIYT